MNLQEMAERAKKASRSVRQLSESTRNDVLHDFAQNLLKNTSAIISENQKDLKEAEANGMSEAMLDRLTLSKERLKGIAEGIEETAALPDPLHQVLEERTLRSGIHLKKITSAIGVIGIIFESRPNVSADCSALCFKAGSACVLKGGKESYRSCKALISCMKEALKKNGVSEDAVMLAEKPSHEETDAFMEDRSSVDLLIPRGGKNLIQAVVRHARVPVIETGAGVCHVYVDATADQDMAERIILNAKCQRPSVCNAMETLLVHSSIAQSFLPRIAKALKEHGVSVYADARSRKIVPSFKEADEESYYTEYNDLIMNLKIVDSTEEAIDHIEKYGTHHSESIITEDQSQVEKFMNGIDSACVYHNASTRFTDGFEFGLGAEIGISTQKLHARGPMGLKELTTYTYHLEGKGEIRQ
jgi:glutamate-5-semialdehyde dehydrogenase